MSAPEAQSARAEEIGRFIVTSSYRPWQYWSWQRSASYYVADVRRGESTAPGVRPCPNRMALMGPRVGDLFGSNSRLLSRTSSIKRLWALRAHRRPPSIQPGSDAAHDYGTGTAERRAIRPGDVAVSCQRQDTELLVLETTKALVNGLLGPLVEVGVPDRAVIAGDMGSAAKRIVRPMPVQDRGENALTLRIGAGALRRTVRRDEDPLDRAAGDVVDPGLDFAHTWSKRVPFDRGHGRVA